MRLLAAPEEELAVWHSPRACAKPLPDPDDWTKSSSDEKVAERVPKVPQSPCPEPQVLLRLPPLRKSSGGEGGAGGGDATPQ